MQKIKIFILILMIAFILAYLYIFSPDIQMLKNTPIKQSIEIENLSVRGRKEGKIQFEISAKKISSDKDQANIYVFDIYDGKFFNDEGKLIAKDLTAEKAIIYQYEGHFSVFGEQNTPVNAKIKLKDNEDFVKITADTVTYKDSLRKIYLENTKISGKKYRIFSPKIEVDTNQKIASLFIYPKINTENLHTRAMTFEYYYDNEILKGTLDAEAIISKNSAIIKAQNILVDLNSNSVNMEGNVTVRQKGKFSTANNLTYNNKTGEIILSGNVKTILEKGKKVLKESTINKIKNAEIRKMLEEGILLNCNKLIMNTNNGDATAEGSVTILQKQNLAKSDYAFFDDKNETITLSGNVYVEKDKQWLKTEKVIASLSREEFEAIGNVQSVIKIKKSR